MQPDFLRLLRIPRRIRMVYYIHWNRIKFRLARIHFGTSMQVSNKVYINIHPTATVSIGSNLTFTSGACFNPLCRNLRGSIYAAENARITIGNDVGISSACLWSQSAISIGNHVKIGGDSILLDTDAHSLKPILRRNPIEDIMDTHSRPIIIEDDVLIGTRCIILKGVTIGARSIIGSGSIVTKNIPADCIAAGNPCRVIRYSKPIMTR